MGREVFGYGGRWLRGYALLGWGGGVVVVAVSKFRSRFLRSGGKCAASGRNDGVVGGREAGNDAARWAGDGAFYGDGLLGGEAAEEVELVAGEEADLDPAEDVVHDRLGVADLLVAGPAGGLEAGVGELLAEDAERHAVLESE